MLSRAAQYGLSSILFLAKKDAVGKRFTAAEIASGIDAPKAFISKILQNLSKNQIISSEKGPGGGFFLSEENLDHLLYEVIVSLEGSDKIHSCLLDIGNCNEDEPCIFHKIYAPGKNKLLNYFKSKTIKDMIYANQVGQKEV